MYISICHKNAILPFIEHLPILLVGTRQPNGLETATPGRLPDQKVTCSKRPCSAFPGRRRTNPWGQPWENMGKPWENHPGQPWKPGWGSILELVNVWSDELGNSTDMGLLWTKHIAQLPGQFVNVTGMLTTCSIFLVLPGIGNVASWCLLRWLMLGLLGCPHLQLVQTVLVHRNTWDQQQWNQCTAVIFSFNTCWPFLVFYLLILWSPHPLTHQSFKAAQVRGGTRTACKLFRSVPCVRTASVGRRKLLRLSKPRHGACYRRPTNEWGNNEAMLKEPLFMWYHSCIHNLLKKTCIISEDFKTHL